MKPLFLTFLLCVIFINSINSQTNFFKGNNTDYKVYDSLIAYENSNIFNGLEYVDQYRSLNVKNHKFYNSYDYLNGFVIYNEQPYFNIKMKYDLLNDLVILEFVNKKVTSLSLNSSLVSQFVLNNNKFVKLDKTEVLAPFYGNGFFKEGYKGTLYSLFIKYRKKKIEKIRNKKVYYVFKDNEVYILFYKNKFYRINSKKDIVNAIPEREKEILDYYGSNKRLFKKNKQQFLLKLLTKLNHLEK